MRCSKDFDRLCKGCLLNLVRYFQYGPIIKKNFKITVPQLFTLDKLRNSDFAHFLNEGANLKMPPDIKPPLIHRRGSEL